MKVDDDAVALGLDSRVREAIDALQAMISRQYPSATFRLSRGPDDPDQVLLEAIVDVDDLDEVLDFVSEYLSRLEDEEGILIHVIPLHTPERVLADLQAREEARRRRSVASSDSADQRTRRAASHTPTVSPRG